MIERWRLSKGARQVVCLQAAHPLGLELRVILSQGSAPNPGSVARGGPQPRSAPSHGVDFWRTQVFREDDAADAAAAEWRAAFEQKGWRAPPARFTRAALDAALRLTSAAQERVPGNNGMGHVLGYRLKVMREALEVAVADDVSLDGPARERRLLDAMRELARAERGPEGQAFVKPILDELK